MNGLRNGARSCVGDFANGSMRAGAWANPKNPNAESDSKEMEAAVNALAKKLVVVRATDDRELEAAFAALAQGRVSRPLRQDRSIFDPSPGTNHIARGKLPLARDLPAARLCRCRGAHELQSQSFSLMAPSRDLCRANFAGREASRSSRSTGDECRVGH
jgi:hypothetical protein